MCIPVSKWLSGQTHVCIRLPFFPDSLQNFSTAIYEKTSKSFEDVVWLFSHSNWSTTYNTHTGIHKHTYTHYSSRQKWMNGSLSVNDNLMQENCNFKQFNYIYIFIKQEILSNFIVHKLYHDVKHHKCSLDIFSSAVVCMYYTTLLIWKLLQHCSCSTFIKCHLYFNQQWHL
jgi:hypothetical protein